MDEYKKKSNVELIKENNKMIKPKIVKNQVSKEELLERNRILSLLYYTSQTFSSVIDLNKVFNIILEKIRTLLNATGCSIWLLDSDTDELVCKHIVGKKKEIVRKWRLKIGVGLVGTAAKNEKSLNIADAMTDNRHFLEIDKKTGLLMRSILSVPFKVKKEVIGVIQVVSTSPNHFKSTDITLLESLATSVAISVENARLYSELQQELSTRKKAEKKLAKSESKLRKQKLELKKKNIALQEVLGQVEIEKQSIKDQIAENVEKLIMPVLKKFKLNAVSIEEEYIDLLISNIEQLTAPFIINLKRLSSKLTPRELEICNLIKNGLRNKEISKILNISPKTIERHRYNIRKKFKINTKKINLPVYLQTL